MKNIHSLKTKSPVLLVGDFLSSSVRNRSSCEELAAQLIVSDWPVITTSSELDRIARLLDMVFTVLRRRKDYVIAQTEVYSGPAFVWAEVVCGLLKLLNKPVILTLRGGKLPEFATRWPGRVRRLLQAATVVTTPSSYLFDKMKPYRADLQILPNALDLNRYHFRWRSKPRPRLIWLRAFHNVYNPSLAPRVLSLLTGTFSDIELTMVGPDKGDGSLKCTKQAATDLNVIDRLVLPGCISKVKVPIWLNTADIFLNTTNADNAPVSVIEAMACGLCVVSTNVGGIPYLLTHERDALLVSPNDPEAMASAVRRILTEPGLAEQLSRNARKKVEQFDWSVILPQWEAMFMRIAG
ncbi:glycosyltransferase family 4 protein [candidate division KSB1 bacterium]|nr:glycosyltransferase family 4 protein [candidate division KSB1 bacterium]